MKKSILIFMTSVLILALFAACSQADEQNAAGLPRSVTISLAGISKANSRTLLPTEPETPDKFDVTLTPVVQSDNGWVTDPANKEIKKEGIALDGNSITITEVKLGTYKVSINAYKDDVLIMNGSTEADSPLQVTATGQNSATVQLNLISSGEYSGNIKVSFDWSEAYDSNSLLKEATDSGSIQFELYMKESLSDTESEFIKYGDAQKVGAGATSYDFTSADLPVTTDGMVYFKVWAGDQLLVNNFKVSVAQIYAGHTSVPDKNEQPVYIINASDIAKAKNISNVDWHFGEGDNRNNPIITWDNVKNRQGVNLLSKVVFYFTEKDNPDAEDIVKEVTGTELGAESFMLQAADFTSDTTYTVAAKAYHTSGYASETQSFDTEIEFRKSVESITINNTPSETLTVGDTFTLNVTVTPDDASIKTFKWEIQNENVVSAEATTGNSTTFTAAGPGSTTITVISDDNENIKYTTPLAISVRLAAPTSVTATSTDKGINVSWQASTGASSYTIYKSEDNAEFTIAKEGVTDTSYTDIDLYAGKSYTYKVVAVYTADSDLNSVDSNTSDSVEIAGTVITVKTPTIINNTIDFGDTPDVSYVMDVSPFKFTVGNIDGASSYKWTFKDQVVADGQTIEINSTSDLFPDDGSDNPNITLTFVVTTASGTYSKPIQVFLITEKDGAVTIDKQDARISANTDENGTPRTLQLNASVESSVGKIIYYSSSNPDLATVDKTSGLVTFNPNATTFGKVKITAASAFGDEPATVTFDVYKATINSETDAQTILSGINSVIRTNMHSAHSSFGDDWWYANRDKTYSNAGITIVGAKGRGTPPDTNANIKISGYNINIDKIGDIKINTSDTIELNITQTWSYLQQNEPSSFGYNGKTTLNVELPYNQGTATINYNNINLESYDESKTNTYSVTFDSSLGTDSYNEDSSAFHGETTITLLNSRSITNPWIE